MTVANVSANMISAIPRQCHPAAITQMVIQLGDKAALARIMLCLYALNNSSVLKLCCCIIPFRLPYNTMHLGKQLKT